MRNAEAGSQKRCPEVINFVFFIATFVVLGKRAAAVVSVRLFVVGIAGRGSMQPSRHQDGCG
jgi:hypothetical protein